VLAVCGGGGNDVAAWLIVLAAFLVWVAGTVLIVKSARDKKEKRLLIALLIVSIPLGPALIAAFYDGVFGSDADFGKLVLLLLVPGAIGAGIALFTRAGHGLRAFLASTWGVIFIGGVGMIMFFAALAAGGGCLE
jgi:hypothetical protein